MEESSNGRLEEVLKVEAHDEEKAVVMEDSAASKPEVEFVRDTISDGNFVSLNGTPDGEDSSSSSSSLYEVAEPVERSSQNSKNVEEERVVSDSVVESVELESGVSSTEESSQDVKTSVEKSVDSTEESSQDVKTSVEKSVDSDVAELDGKKTEENISPSVDETNVDSTILTDLLINGSKEETEKLSSSETTGDSAILTDGDSKGIDEGTTRPGLDETNGSMVAADVETTISCLAENGGVPAAAVAQGIMETKIAASDNNAGISSCSPDSAAKENVEDSLLAANVPIIETRDAGELVSRPAIRESIRNQPIISLSHRSVQPTSWKSCCGLFEVLRRSR